jgi:hypothetical protein
METDLSMQNFNQDPREALHFESQYREGEKVPQMRELQSRREGTQTLLDRIMSGGK